MSARDSWRAAIDSSRFVVVWSLRAASEKEPELKDLFELHFACYQRIGKLNPSAFLSRAADYSRGGLPGQSMSDGRGGGEGIPGFDKDDRLIRRKRKAYIQGFDDLQKLIAALELLEGWMLNIPEPIPDDPIFPCGNLACTNVLEAGLKSGQCGRCRTHKHRYGLDWPAKGSDVTGLRQTSVEEMIK